TAVPPGGAQALGERGNGRAAAGAGARMAGLVMPVRGADMRAGTPVAWRKRPGDAVHRGAILAEVETGTAGIQVEVCLGGIGERLRVEAGTEVGVGRRMARSSAVRTPVSAVVVRGDAAWAARTRLQPVSARREGSVRNRLRVLVGIVGLVVLLGHG